MGLSEDREMGLGGEEFDIELFFASLLALNNTAKFTLVTVRGENKNINVICSPFCWQDFLILSGIRN